MMQISPLVPVSYVIGILVVVLLSGGIPIFLNWKSGIYLNKILVKSVLLLLFGLFLGLFLLQPSIEKSQEEAEVLVYSKDVDDKAIQFWKDSLGIEKAESITDFQPTEAKVVLVGKDFSKEELYSIRNSSIRWILPEKDQEISDLTWKGYVRKGEKQRLNYRIFSEKDTSKLELKQTETVLANAELYRGWNEGLLEFPTAGLGKSEVPLYMDGDSVAFFRFFIGPSSPKKYHFQFSFPGQEVRVLSQWLESKGEKVSQEIRLSRATILEGGNAATDSLQIRLIDPSQLELKSLQDWVKAAEGALVILNLSDPIETANRVNLLFGTDFQVQRVGQNESIILENQLETASFSWVEKLGQEVLGDGSIAVQRVGEMQIAISLYESTFPLFLQGKEKEYEMIWGELFGELEPAEPISWNINAPVLSGISTEIQLNKTDSIPQWIYSQVDSVNFVRALTNPFLAKGNFLTDSTGWVDFGDDFSAYVYGKEELPSLHANALLKPMTFRSEEKDASTEFVYTKISNWIWLIGMMLSLGLMWLEPKISF